MWFLAAYGWDCQGGHANGLMWVGCVPPFSSLGAAIVARLWNARSGPGGSHRDRGFIGLTRKRGGVTLMSGAGPSMPPRTSPSEGAGAQAAAARRSGVSVAFPFYASPRPTTGTPTPSLHM